MLIRRGAPLAVLLIAFAVYTFNLSAQSLWYDEGYNVMFALRDWGELITGAARLELNTPLHYIFLKIWLLFAGTSEFVARLFSSFCGVATVALVVTLTRHITRHASVLPALLVALSPVCALMFRETRMYAMAACLCVASVVAFTAALRHKGARRWLIWASVSLAAFATHVLSAFVVVAQFAILLLHWITSSDRRERQRMLVAALTVAIPMGLAAAVIFLGRESYGTTFSTPLNVVNTFRESLAAYVLPRLLPASLIDLASVSILFILALAGLALRKQQLALHIWVVGVMAVALIALFCVLTGKFSSRYPALVSPIVTVAIGFAVVSIMPAPAKAGIQSVTQSQFGHLHVLLAILLTMVSLFGLVQIFTNRIYANDNYRDAVAYIEANRQPDETVLLVSGHIAPMYEYYAGHTDTLALPNDPVLRVGNALTWENAVPPMNSALAGKGGAWLLLWQDDLVDPTGLVPALLRRQSEAFTPKLDTTEFRGLHVQHYRFFQPYQPSPVVLPMSQSTIEPIGQTVGLMGLGCVQPNQTHAGAGYLEVQCFWQVKPFVQLSGFTKVSLRLFDALGKQVLQSDQPIAPNGMPYFPYEKPILGLYLIELPKDIAPGAYLLRAIPYAEQGELSPQVVTQIQILPK
jgi:4-amino-4-deoxy-L-arabinose transferase-like glycosyltransferase